MEGKGKGVGLVDVKVSPVNLRTGIIQANMEKKKRCLVFMTLTSILL